MRRTRSRGTSGTYRGERTILALCPVCNPLVCTGNLATERIARPSVLTLEAPGVCRGARDRGAQPPVPRAYTRESVRPPFGRVSRSRGLENKGARPREPR